MNQYETAVDDFVLSDLIMLCNDEKYFIFQDMMEQVMMMFYRDKQVLELMKSKPHAPIYCTNSQDKITGVFPQCGIIPFKHFTKWFAPLCFISNSKEDCYYIYRAFYCKYFCYLTSISSHP